MPAIKAQFVRIYPKSWYSYIAMRVELYGCRLRGKAQAYQLRINILLTTVSQEIQFQDYREIKTLRILFILDQRRTKNSKRFSKAILHFCETFVCHA